MDSSTAKTVSGPIGSSGFSMSETDKYGGMIQRSLYKRVRNNLFSLTSYMYSVCPSLSLMHSFISFMRILQFIGPSLFVPFKNFWIKDSFQSKMINLFSVFFHLFPTSARENVCSVFSYVYVAVLGVICIIVVISSFYYKENAKLPKSIALLIYIFINTFGYLLHPIAMEISGESLGRIIKNGTDSSGGYRILEIGLVMIMFMIYTWMMATITSTSLIFYPSSFISALSSPQMLVYYSTNSITLITAVASQLSGNTRTALVIIGGLLYLISTRIVFHDGGFVMLSTSKQVLASSLTGFLHTIGFLVLVYKGMTGTEAMIFLVFFTYIFFYIVASALIEKNRSKSFELLDLIENDNINFASVSNPGQFLRLAIDGFVIAHPSCLTFECFKLATEKWPDNVNVWVLFAKFVAIYVEENQTLGWILHQMISHRLKGAVAKHVMTEIVLLMRTRESNISPELKKKIGKITKKVQMTRHKLRHIWDLVIQGNLGDMGNFINKTYYSIEETKADYNHLLRQYPNSRFVIRSYARFLYDIIADQEMFKEWAEKAKLMQRGIQVHPDQAHELGLALFSNIPLSIEKRVENVNLSQAPIESESQLIDIDTEDEKNSLALEQSSALRQQIRDLTIPGTFCTTLSRVLIILFIFIAPMVFAAIYINIKEEELVEPLNYLYYLSMLRNHVFMDGAFGLRYIHEQLGIVTPRNNVIDPTKESPPTSLGGTWDLGMQFSYLLKESAQSVQDLNGLRSLSTDGVNLQKAKDIVFGDSINYSVFVNTTFKQYRVVSVQIAIMESLMQLSNIFSGTIENSIFNSSKIVNAPANSNNIAEKISSSLALIIDSMRAVNSELQNLFVYLRVIGYIFYPCFLIAILLFQIHYISENRLIIFRCMTSLPKNVVSCVADSLKIMKNDQEDSTSKTETDSELNKQEENMIKVFATAGDSSSSGSSNEDFVVMFGTVCSAVAGVLFTYFVCAMFSEMSESVFDSAPHIDYLMGAFAYQSTLMFISNLLATDSVGLPVRTLERTALFYRVPTRLANSLNFYHNARFGLEDGSETPFKEFDEGISEQNAKRKCSVTNIQSVSTMREAYECLSLEMLFYSFEIFIRSVIEPNQQINVFYGPNHEVIWNMWEMEFTFIYDRLFSPIFLEIVPSVRESVLSTVSSNIVISLVIVILAAMVECIMIIHNLEVEKQLRFALSLLLKCSPHTVIQIPLIANVLGGNFRVQKNDTSSRDKLFFDEVLVQLPESIIITDETGTIVSSNNRASKLFNGIEMIKMPIADFFKLPCFSESANLIVKAPPQEEDITYQDTNKTTYNLTVKSFSFNEMSAYTFKDVTQYMRYNTLIEEERTKSDKLLESILPPKLVTRVQKGEKDISFSVQSASVCFIDIVEFTPWCASNPAKTVMLTLNRLYREFDGLVAKYPTITKIKCIGDCYMAASGIFSEINQPNVHAKEMVEFGLEAIGAVGRINEETEQNLRIRVGINTGGPLVAGVLGCGKPTFEILGPTINMAQQMEHHGIPMQIHISRAVYELIYGGPFKIKERGQIEIKNGSVITYLVNP